MQVQRNLPIVLLMLIAIATLTLPLAAQEETSEQILINNVRIFDGESETLTTGNVLVESNLIKIISDSPIQVKSDTNIIEGGGRVLMPGLSDAHWHVALAAVTLEEAETEESDFLYARAIKGAERTLLRGFTTVRDIGGPVFGIKKAIDQGIIPGPRILPSGAMVSQTAGHGDFSHISDQPARFGGPRSRFEQLGAVRVADGVDDVLAAVRTNLKQGASQIKLMAGGGVTSKYDPLDVNQYRLEEIKAAVDAASDWGTYVTVHIYTSSGIRRALEAGVRGIEHGHLMDEEAAKVMAEKDAWLCIQPFFREDAGRLADTDQRKPKFLQVADGFDNAMRLVKKFNIRMAFGTDLIFAPQTNRQQASWLLRFKKYFTNVEILRMTTSANAEMFQMSGNRHPYQEGPLGVINEGAYADLLIVDGNPLENLEVLTDFENNLKVIMKDGKVYKNTLKK